MNDMHLTDQDFKIYHAVRRYYLSWDAENVIEEYGLESRTDHATLVDRMVQLFLKHHDADSSENETWDYVVDKLKEDRSVI